MYIFHACNIFFYSFIHRASSFIFFFTFPLVLIFFQPLLFSFLIQKFLFLTLSGVPSVFYLFFFLLFFLFLFFNYLYFSSFFPLTLLSSLFCTFSHTFFSLFLTLSNIFCPLFLVYMYSLPLTFTSCFT